MNKVWMFFEDEERVPSMTRLLCFLSFFPASWVVVKTSEADTLAWYLSAYTASYIGGKAAAGLGKLSKPTIRTDKVENINASGDVNVSSGGKNAE